MKNIFLLILCCSVFLSAKIYKGAEYRTKASYTYGRFEVRLKSSYREGMLTSFFTYNDDYPNTPWNEIDIEILGRYDDDVQFNPITPGQINHVSHYRTPFNPASGYHIYGFEWTPNYVAWFIDGAEVHRQTGAHIEALNLPQKIMMNIWNPVYYGWVGQWNDNVLPVFSYYDWVSYSSYTPGTGTSGTGNNFTLQWNDEFNSWDQDRWEKATHTFNGNNCDFIQANAVFQDGKLILCLTKESPTGFVDYSGPSVKYARAEANGVMMRFSEELDPVSAEDPAHYINSAMPITKAQLQQDSQSVFLTLTQYQKDSILNVIVTNINDRSTSLNSSGLKNAVLIKSQPLSFPVKINCGGSAYKEYLADQEWGPSAEYGRVDATVNQNANTISGTTEQEVYRTELNGIVEYKVRVPNGTYSVTLMMAENYFSEAGKRKFSAAVQGNIVAKDLDLYAVAGKSVSYLVIAPSVPVTDGIIDIHFMAQIDFALLNGIVIVPVGTGVNEHEMKSPGEWNIGQNYPNPFNGKTVINIRVPFDDRLSIKFYDTLGRKIYELPVGTVTQGDHSFTWNGRDSYGRACASGIYYYVVQGTLQSSVKKMMLIQ